MSHRSPSHNHFRSLQLVIPIGWNAEIGAWDGNRKWSDRLILTSDIVRLTNIRDVAESLRFRALSHSVIAATFSSLDQDGEVIASDELRLHHGDQEVRELRADLLDVLVRHDAMSAERRIAADSAFQPVVLRPHIREIYTQQQLLTQAVLIGNDAKGASEPIAILKLTN
jgi:hypothetical protein